MPAQKRAYEAEDDDPLQSIRNNYHYEHDEEDGDESDRSPSSNGGGDKEEYVVVKLAEIRKEVQCPICLGIIRKTRTVMECLHRFCRECIDKSMRLGNNECPACRTHCASRRSLRDDPNYDALIAVLYPDIDKYEEEELNFDENEKARNKQIQATIAQTLQRQSEALGRKKTVGRGTAAAFMRRLEGSYRSAYTRARRNYRAAELHGYDDEDDANGQNEGKDSSSADERVEVKPKRCRRWGSARLSQPSTAASAVNRGGSENDSEVHRESMGVSVGLGGNSDILAWGRGGIRSHTRYGSASSGNGKNARNSRLPKLADYFKNMEANDCEMDTHLMLVSSDEQHIPTLQRPYLCCRPTLSIRHLCQYVALHLGLKADEVEILAVSEQQNPDIILDASAPGPNSIAKIVDVNRDTLRILEEQETLTGLQTACRSQGHLLLVYRKKKLVPEDSLLVSRED